MDARDGLVATFGSTQLISSSRQLQIAIAAPQTVADQVGQQQQELLVQGLRRGPLINPQLPLMPVVAMIICVEVAGSVKHVVKTWPQVGVWSARRCKPAPRNTCLVLSCTRHWLGERSALGEGPVGPYPTITPIYAPTCPKGLGEPPCWGSPEFGFPLSPTASHTSSHTSNYFSPTPTTHSTPHPPEEWSL
jgi:hypothetical protein